MNNNNSKKRKRDIISELKGTVETAHLKVRIPDCLPCQICKIPVFNYRALNGPITCSYTCFSIYHLSLKNNFLDEQDKMSFDDEDPSLKRSESIDDFMTFDED